MSPFETILPPSSSSDDAATDPLLLAKQALEQTFEKDLLIEEFAAIAKMHPDTFSRKFKRRFGVSPVTYRVQCRLNHAAQLAGMRPDLTIRQIAKQSGFHHFSYFHRLFQKHFGVTPAVYGGRRPTTVPPPPNANSITPEDAKALEEIQPLKPLS
jgi:transcriptional regulator GlxA family with amidase domain